eukprot:COSAG02_NODE_2314_length_9156_cov_8.075072_7_plen_252_part_00
MLRVLAVAVALSAVLSGVEGRGGGTRTPEDPNTESGRECRDGVDNDGDGTMDCEDPDCATMRMCTGAGTGGATRPGQLPEDPNTETGRECVDGQDNDADGKVDCADPDCAAITQICGDPTCFVAGSEYTSARCCDTSKGATGDLTCWGGGYDFNRCCPRTVPTRPTRPTPPADGTADCSIRGFARISTNSCPAPKSGARVPDTCPADCATAFSTWQTACADQAAATIQEANAALGGGVDAFVALCQASIGH